ncbi:protein phosphatase 2C-related protein [Cavenderia fasciculata]|uniref:Protein phosphatase 2C-related protein n=1 Tax=Cavenderia fasciculata TaxID=261658 RepID=F4PI73_CACFS|nr:protein phosphatase 2C-related protein [Cavenderia fasciculata]EGG25356.1 protein phosphatase 2C-related protein [Cavenderia fasciculata]|eukprot:XP_004363207.1 protein phosphatase 2C-related protein [Cavenderia fasciculata]
MSDNSKHSTPIELVTVTVHRPAKQQINLRQSTKNTPQPITSSQSRSTGSLINVDNNNNYWKEEALKWEQIANTYLEELTYLKAKLAKIGNNTNNSLSNNINNQQQQQQQELEQENNSSLSSLSSLTSLSSFNNSSSNTSPILTSQKPSSSTSSSSLSTSSSNPISIGTANNIRQSTSSSNLSNFTNNNNNNNFNMSSPTNQSDSSVLSTSAKKKKWFVKFLDGKKDKKDSNNNNTIKDSTDVSNNGGIDQSSGFEYNERGLSTQYHHLPKLQVVPLKCRGSRLTYAKFTGPDYSPPAEPNPVSGAPKTVYEATYSDSIYAISTSTYPYSKGNLGRDGDPIADRYNCVIFENRLIACLADGCNWGARPKEAAMKASEAFLDYMVAKNDQITDVKEAGKILFGAFEQAHISIMKGKDEYWEAGTTTLLGGVLCQINKGQDKWSPEWEFVLASVGDCKAYVLSGGEVCDITEGNRMSLDPKDCGGRLGPHLEEGKPDLRNLNIFCASVNTGDLIILTTDGIYDNLDPLHLGKTPQDMSKVFNLTGSKWADVDLTKAFQAKTAFTTSFLESILTDLDEPSKIANRLIQHCWNTTESSRDFLENNPGKRLPQDYNKYPGKMDHTTCICFRVGEFDLDEPFQQQQQQQMSQQLGSTPPGDELLNFSPPNSVFSTSPNHVSNQSQFTTTGQPKAFRDGLLSSNGKDWVKTSPSTKLGGSLSNLSSQGLLSNTKSGSSSFNLLDNITGSSPVDPPIVLAGFKPTDSDKASCSVPITSNINNNNSNNNSNNNNLSTPTPSSSQSTPLDLSPRTSD